MKGQTAAEFFDNLPIWQLPVAPAAMKKPVAGLPDRRRNTVFAAGLWSDEAEAARLWADCLAGRTEGGGFLQKLEATARLHGYPRTANEGICVVNMA